MLKLPKWTIGFALAAMVPGVADAGPYVFNFAGTSTGTNTPFSGTLNLDVASSGAVATFISGNQDGVAVTGLSSYAGADNTVSFTSPFLTFGGLSFAIPGESFNLYFNNGSYYEANSITDPQGVIPNLNPISFLSVNGEVLSGAVPEPATWAMMLLGFAGIGVSLRRRRKVGAMQIA